MMCADEYDGIGVPVCDVAPWVFAPWRRWWPLPRAEARARECAPVRTLGCFRTTRPGYGPKTSAFVTLYSATGYCRLRDGRDPVYQRRTAY